MTTNLKIDIPGVDFEEMARTAIAAKLTEALIGADDAIIKIVAASLSKKVDDRGVVSNYPSSNKTPYVEFLFQELVQKATKEALAKKVEEMRPKLEDAVSAALLKNTKSIASALVSTYTESAERGYYLTTSVDVKLKQRG